MHEIKMFSYYYLRIKDNPIKSLNNKKTKSTKFIAK